MELPSYYNPFFANGQDRGRPLSGEKDSEQKFDFPLDNLIARV